MDDVTRAMSKGCVLVNVQEWGCFSIFLRADDVTRTMPKGGGGGACECPRVGVFFKIAEGGGRHADKGVLVKNPVSAPGPPPPFKNPGSAPVMSDVMAMPVLVIGLLTIPP